MKHFAEIISKILPVLVIALSAASSSFAADNDSLYRIYSGNLMAYPYTDVEPPAQTPVPDGYTPFHIEHYGRHGSRWLIGHNDYATPVERLTRAERAGKLTPLGRKTLEALRSIEAASERREGELSDKGCRAAPRDRPQDGTQFPRDFHRRRQCRCKGYRGDTLHIVDAQRP